MQIAHYLRLARAVLQDWVLKSRWVIWIGGALLAYALIGFLVVPFLVQRYVPPIASEKLQRQVSIGKVAFNPLLFKLEIADFALKEPDGTVMLSFGHLFADLELSGLFRRAVALRRINLEKLFVHPDIGPDGRLNFARIADAFPPSQEPEPEEEASPMPRLLIDRLALVDGAVEFSDRSKNPPVSERLEAINLRLDSISTLPDEQAAHHLAAGFPDGSKIDWHGHLSLNPIASTGELKLDGFKLATPWPFVKDRLALEPPEGDLSVGASYRFRKDGESLDLGLDKIGVTLAGLKLVPMGGGEPLAALDRLQISQGTFSLAEQSLKIPEFVLSKGKIKASIDAGGQLDLQQLMKPTAPTAAQSAPAASPPPAAPEPSPASPVPATPASATKPWQIAIDAFRLEELALQFTDASRRLPLDFSVGSFGLGFQATAEVGSGEPKVSVGGLSTEIRSIGLLPLGGKEPMLSIDSFRITDGAVDLAARQVKLPSMTVSKGLVQAAVDTAGSVDWQRIAEPAAGPAVPQAKAPTPPPPPAKQGKNTAKPGKRSTAKAVSEPSSAPWHVNVDNLKIEQIGVRYADDSRKAPLAVEIGSFGLGLSAAIEAGAGDPKVLLDALQSEIQHVVLKEPSKAKPLASLDLLAVSGGKLDLSENAIGIQQIALKGGATAIERDESGVIHMVEMFAPRDQGKLAPPTRAVQKVEQVAASEGKPLRLAVEQLGLSGFQVAFQDRSVTPVFAMEVRPAEFRLKSFSTVGKSPMSFDGKLHVVQGGELSILGSSAPSGERGQAEIRLDRFVLPGFQPYIEQIGALKMESGDVSTHLKIAFEQKAGNLSLTAKGDAGSGNLMLKEAKSGKRFVSWEKLSVDGIDFSLGPDKLTIKEIVAVKPGANIEIFEDRGTNIAAIFAAKKPAASPAKVPAKAAAVHAKYVPPPPAPAKSAPAKPLPVSVQRVKVEQAIFDFSDLSLVLPFKTRIQNFGGTITGISTAPSSRTLLKLDGRVDEYGEANLEGSLDLMQHKAFSDVTLTFRNVEMSSLSPYSGTFAGRRIQSGKLNAELQYKIENSNLKSNGKIELDKVKLGDEVVSPKAASLPLDLALALLSDSNGRITVSVPIEGNVDSPQFAYGPVIWNAVTTLITKVVTAPFTALAGVFGSGEDDGGQIFFIPGKNGLPPAEIEKLKKISGGLATRPSLIVKVTGTFDPKLDTEALKSWDVRTAVTERLGIQVAPGEDPGPVAFGDAKAQKALEDIADDTNGGTAVVAAQEAFRQKFGREPKRIGAFSSLMAKASEDADFYQLLFDGLVKAAPLAPNALDTLGDRRGQAIVKELTAQKGVDRNRVRAEKPASVEEQGGRIPAKLDLTTGGS